MFKLLRKHILSDAESGCAGIAGGAVNALYFAAAVHAVRGEINDRNVQLPQLRLSWRMCMMQPGNQRTANELSAKIPLRQKDGAPSA